MDNTPSQPESATAPAHSQDPAHSSQPNTDHTTKDGTKPSSVMKAITDTDFLPSLDEAPIEQKAKSYSLLILLVLGAIGGAWFMGLEVLQVGDDRSWVDLAITLGSVSVVLLGLLYWTGTGTIDIWSLVMEWGWYTIPVAGAAGLLFVIVQERTEAVGEVD